MSTTFYILPQSPKRDPSSTNNWQMIVDDTPNKLKLVYLIFCRLIRDKAWSQPYDPYKINPLINRSISITNYQQNISPFFRIQTSQLQILYQLTNIIPNSPQITTLQLPVNYQQVAILLIQNWLTSFIIKLQLITSLNQQQLIPPIWCFVAYSRIFRVGLRILRDLVGSQETTSFYQFVEIGLFKSKYTIRTIINILMQTSANTLYETEILKPQVFILFSALHDNFVHMHQSLINYYKFTPLIFSDLLNQYYNKQLQIANHTDAKSLQPRAEILDSNINKQLGIRLLKKQLALNGAKRYLIADFPQNKQFLQEFVNTLGSQAEIKKVILLKGISSIQDISNADQQKQMNQDISQSLKDILQELQKDRKIINGDLSKSKEQVFEQVRDKLNESEVYPLRPVQVFFVSGGPGAGKGTQCANLVKDYGFKHLSTGDLLRDAIKNGSKQGLAIEQCIKNGQLVSSSLLVDLIKCEIRNNNYSGKYLIDGFPRNVENDEVWTQMMEHHAVVKGLLYMKCSEDIMEKRIIQRSKTSGRSDDNIQTMKKRFKVYYTETQPIIQRYQTKNNVIQIDSEKPTEEVYSQIQQELLKKSIVTKNLKSKDQPGVILVLGGPGSGKGTQCDNLVRCFGFKHLSTGDLLRQEQSQRGLNSELIEDYIKEGKLVPSKILVRLIKKAMIQRGWNGIYLLDGFPRNLQNIQAWQKQIGDHVNIQHCLLFDCSQKVMSERLLSRGKTSGRIDDNPETIKKRFNTFQKQTTPIIARYEVDHANIKVNAEQEIGEVFQKLKGALIEKGFKPL